MPWSLELWFVYCSLQRPSVERRHQERCLAAGGLGRSSVLHRWGHKDNKSLTYSGDLNSSVQLRTFKGFGLIYSWVSTVSSLINIKCTLSLEETLNKLQIAYVSHFLQFLLFSTWTPGSWSRPRLPHYSEVRHGLGEDTKLSPFIYSIDPGRSCQSPPPLSFVTSSRRLRRMETKIIKGPKLKSSSPLPAVELPSLFNRMQDDSIRSKSPDRHRV